MLPRIPNGRDPTTPTHSEARAQLRAQREAQLTSPVNRIRRIPDEDRLPIPFSLLGAVGPALPNALNVAPAVDDPFQAAPPHITLTQQIEDNVVGMRAVRDNLNAIRAAIPAAPPIVRRGRGRAGQPAPALRLDEIRARLAALPQPAHIQPPHAHGRGRGGGRPPVQVPHLNDEIHAHVADLPQHEAPNLNNSLNQPPDTPAQPQDTVNELLQQQAARRAQPVLLEELHQQRIALDAQPIQHFPLLKIARRPSTELRDIVQPHYLGPSNVTCQFCNALHWEAEKTTKSTARNKLFGCCCKSGKIELPLLQPPPPPLDKLLTENTSQAKKFREHIRRVNSAFAFVSVGVKLDSVTRLPGPFCFKICGAMHHKIGGLRPDGEVVDDSTNCFAQIYIHDGDTTIAAERRAQVANMPEGIYPETWRSLQHMLHESNPYIELFRQAYQILNDFAPDQRNSVEAVLHVDKRMDMRRYNLPTANEIAAIIPSGGDEGYSKDLIVRYRGQGLWRLYDTNPMYQPLFYVLLFPRGELGWQLGIRYSDRHANMLDEQQPNEINEDGDENMNGGQRQGNAGDGDNQRSIVSRREYYAFRLHSRLNEGETLLRGGKLFQQFIVDAWAVTEQQQLRWIKDNQRTLRADQYRGLSDAIHHGDNPQNQGTRVILPSSHLNSTRFMYQLFQDSMAIHRHYEHADVFITMTANPNWKEIQEALLPGQTAADRPDIVSRVFELKKRALLDDIMKKGVMGRHAAHVYTVEFQKRGLPHMHLIVFFSHEDKIRSPDDFKHMVRADIPDPTVEPTLHKIVTETMLHTCNDKCKVDGKCSKRFPKPFNETASMTEGTYANYCRPNNGRTYTKVRHNNEVVYTNQHVVPYCPYFSLKYECHINVEVCISVGSIKYIHKYIYKGHDRTTMLLDQGDEVQQYIDARYLAPHECMYRIMAWHLHEERPNVYRLPVHLPGDQTIYYDEEVTEDQIERQSRTHLTAYFNANTSFAEARMTYYQDFPGSFVWVHKTRRWKPRQRGWALGRMYTVHPNAGEKFYLRLLLTQVKGATSFESLRTVNGICYPSFKEACFHLGLLEDDREWQQCLTEASIFKTGSQLRSLFVTLLTCCNPISPVALWNEFKNGICDDLQRKLQHTFPEMQQPTQEEIYDYGLYLIDNLLFSLNKRMSDFAGMPVSEMNWEARAPHNRLIMEQLDYEHEQEIQKYQANVALFTQEQLHVFDTVVNRVVDRLPGFFFLYAAGGCGKTFVSNTICNRLRGDSIIVLCVASSGIASILLNGGRTVHSRFKVPINVNETTTCAIPKNSPLAQLLQRTALIIYDEAPMHDRFIPEAIDRTLRDLCNSDEPFGGIPVMCSGDWRQCLPVIPKGSRQQIVNACLTRSHLWRGVELLILKENKRLENRPEDREFAKWLLDVGEGKHASEYSSMELPQSLRCGSTLDDLFRCIYPGLEQHQADGYFAERAILTARNTEVEELNALLLNKFPGELKTFNASDNIQPEDGADVNQDIVNMYQPEYLASLNTSGLPLSKFQLKIGAPVMLLRNLDPTNGLCNGTRGIVINTSQRVIEIRITSGNFSGTTAFIPRIILDSNESDFPFKLRRRQFPLRLAFAMTINKSQGQSLKHVGLDLRTPVFSHGQLYVGLSRCTASDRIYVLFPETENGTSTMNVVFQEALLREG